MCLVRTIWIMVSKISPPPSGHCLILSIQHINLLQQQTETPIMCINSISQGAPSTPASCECHVCTAPPPTSKQDSSLPLFPPKCSTPSPCPSSLYPHLYLPSSSTTSSSTSLPSVVSSVASLSAALSSALQLTTSQGLICPHFKTCCMPLIDILSLNSCYFSSSN